MLKKKVLEFVDNPYDVEINLDLGYIYEQQNQLASALSHYMRGAEYGLDNNYTNSDILISECLYRAAETFIKLGSRVNSTKALVLHAISNTPQISQLYLLLSRIYEQTGEWNECHSVCNIGLTFIKKHHPFKYNNKTRQEVLNELLYQKAIASYYIGKTDKARIDLELLKKQPNLQSWIVEAINNSLKVIGQPVLYKQLGYEKVKSKRELFKDNRFISFSQCLQDVLVSSVIGKNGTYLEIGSGDPFKNNNTYLLERDYNWKGISVDIDEDMVTKFNSSRNNKAIAADARKVDYSKLLKDNNFNKVVEYLQVDCEPPEVTLETLYQIPFDEYKFAIITFEHDAYRSPETRDKSREYLEDRGYKLLISNVSYNNKNSFEDWWIHPKIITKYISLKKLQTIKNIDNNIKGILDIFL